MDAVSWVGVVVVATCLALVAFVAAAEAGLISISRARVRLLAGQGVPRARILQSYVQERQALLRALALARNLAIVVAAALGVAVLTREIGHDWALVAVVVAGALAAVALLEAVTRLIVARSPERWGLRLSPFMGAFKLAFGLPARLLDLPLRAVLRGRPQATDEEEEMLRLMELEEDAGEIEEEERKMIRGVFGLEDTTVREIMTPRTDIVAVEAEATPQEAARLIIESGFSRIPVYAKTLDQIIGVIYAKDLMRFFAEGQLPRSLVDICRPAIFVPESKRLDDLLSELRRRRVHMAIVVDEYGGTAGLVTIEDLIEEIVGEIEDEYDTGEERIVQVSDREATFDGRVAIDEVNDLFHIDIKAEEFDTVAGCVFHLLGRMPAVGDEAESDGVRLRVVAVEGHRIKRVRVTLLEPPPHPPETANGRPANGNGERREANG
jgi:CBS domain containing-hemolysin-like protein